MCNTKSEDHVLKVNVSDLVLTPSTCATLINEFLKCLLYSKAQIPYPYTWLTNVSKRKANEDEKERPKNNKLTIEKHRREILNAYNVLEEMMENLRSEFENPKNDVSEVVFLFGSMPQIAKEIFTIHIPKKAKGHYESNHSRITAKNQHKILRQIFLSNIWMKTADVSLPLTNLFVFLKKTTTDNEHHNNFFNLSRNFSMPVRVKNTVIELNYKVSEDVSCCSNLSVFLDTPSKSTSSFNSDNSSDNFNEDNSLWYQANVMFKGFKDCFINKVSVSQLC